MTTLNYHLAEQWVPIPTSLRKWEQPSGPPALGIPPALPPGPRASTSRTGSNSDHVDDDSDFAAEAAFVPKENHTERPEAPRLGQEHVWGVRDDWGPRARAWGRGVRAFSDSDSKAK